LVDAQRRRDRAQLEQRVADEFGAVGVGAGHPFVPLARHGEVDRAQHVAAGQVVELDAVEHEGFAGEWHR
jgi:hypothetical protein